MSSLSSELFSGLLSHCGWNPKPFTYKVLRDILHSRPLWYPHQPCSHGYIPTSVPLAPLLPQTHQIFLALPLDTLGSSCLSGLCTLLFWRGKVAPPRASVSSDLVYRGLFSSSGRVYVWHIFIWYVYFHFHLFPPKVKLYKDTLVSVFTAKIPRAWKCVWWHSHNNSTENKCSPLSKSNFFFEICD